MNRPSDLAQEIQSAVTALRHGGLVAFPTETVYGLGADASNPQAVGRIFAAKGRPADHPLIVHLPEASLLTQWAKQVPAAAWKLADAFWPGPLTLVLHRAPTVSDVVTGGMETVALRVPAHPVALALLTAFGGGVAAPSANRYGRVSPTEAQHVRDGLGDAVDLVLDGGRCNVGVESTIVDLSSAAPRLLRPGAITESALQEVLGCPVLSSSAGSVRAPGRKASHYAPSARVVPTSYDEALGEVLKWQASGHRVGLLAPGRPAQLPNDVAWLSFGADTTLQARNLYEQLHQADRLGLQVLVAAMPDDTGVGCAVRDRLWRAAGLGDGDA